MTSTLDPDRLPLRPTRKTQLGHDLGALGPSDSSDTGADMIGPGLVDDELIGLDRGTNEDSEGGHLNEAADAGASVGDLGMDETSDRSGTGVRSMAGREQTVRPGADIGFDRVVGPEAAGLGGGLDQAEEAVLGITDEELAAAARRDSDE
jgi:hypothetical protein